MSTQWSEFMNRLSSVGVMYRIRAIKNRGT